MTVAFSGFLWQCGKKFPDGAIWKLWWHINTFLSITGCGFLYLCGPPRQPSGEQETWPTWEVLDWWKTHTWHCLHHKRCLLDSSALYHHSTQPAEEITKLFQPMARQRGGGSLEMDLICFGICNSPLQIIRCYYSNGWLPSSVCVRSSVERLCGHVLTGLCVPCYNSVIVLHQ